MERLGPHLDEEFASSVRGLETEDAKEFDLRGDPRDYFRKTMFEKIGGEIDPDKSHPWQDIYSDSLLLRGEFGTIISGETYSHNTSNGDLEGGLLIAIRSAEGEADSIFLRDVDHTHRDIITSTLSSFAPTIPREQRISYAQKVLDGLRQVDRNYPAELIALQLSEFSLSLLSDQGERAASKPSSIDWGEGMPSSEQIGQMTELLSAVSRKMDDDEFRARLSDIEDDLRGNYLNDPFGVNFPHLLTRIARWPVDYSSAHPRDYESLRRDQPKDFPIKNQIRQPISSMEQLQDILEVLPVEGTPPELNDREATLITGTSAEFVELRNIVGGPLENSSWTVSSSMGRGVENIYKLAETFQSGDSSAFEDANPISVSEFKGKYYISTDGRHRTAALKALGVAYYPMLVTHYSELRKE